jgi:membrane dipeptidase
MRDFLAEARELHATSVVLDGHADTPQRFVDEGWNWTGDPLGMGQLSAETAREGGLDGGFLIAWPEPEAWAGRFAERARTLIASIHEQARKHPEALAVCRTPKEILAAREAGRFAGMIGVEGGHAIENDLGILREFFNDGARYMTLTWANSNDWCGSSGAGLNATGLTSFGREVVNTMNGLGMLVDVSHVSDAAFWDVLETSKVPVIASHSSSRAICGALRNLTDEMAIALAAKGGLVMVNFYAAFVSDAYLRAYKERRPEFETALAPLRKEYAERGVPVPFHAELEISRPLARTLPAIPLSVLVDHFDHLLRLVGPGHVGIGSDFDGITLSVEGMETAADLPKITAGLLQRGWAADDLKGLLGANLLRVMSAAQDYASA